MRCPGLRNLGAAAPDGVPDRLDGQLQPNGVMENTIPRILACSTSTSSLQRFGTTVSGLSDLAPGEAPTPTIEAVNWAELPSDYPLSAWTKRPSGPS